MTLKINMAPTRSDNLVTFTLDRELVPPGTGMSFANASAGEGHPLARALFHIRGIKSLWFLGNDIQVTKDPRSRWSSIIAQILETIRAHESIL